MTQSLGLWDFLVINFDANPKIRGMKKVLQWKKEFSKKIQCKEQKKIAKKQ